jgi:Calcineurin-like phosphoesterase
MRAQVFSDLHLDHAGGFTPKPAADADLLIVPGDIGHSPDALTRLAGWPVPVIFVPGNHEYDGADLSDGDEELQEMCDALGFTLLNCASTVLDQPSVDGRRIRLVGASRWWDFDLLGADRRDECMAFGERYLRHMGSAWRGQPLHSPDVRNLALHHREWLEAELHTPFDGVTVAITHAAPSARSADPRYGLIPGTASFCNSDDDLLTLVPLWIHGHLHCAHDYSVSHANGTTRVLCNPRGYERLGEPKGFVGDLVVDI